MFLLVLTVPDRSVDPVVDALKKKELLTFTLTEDMEIAVGQKKIPSGLVLQHMLMTVLEELRQMPLWNKKICLACPGILLLKNPI